MQKNHTKEQMTIGVLEPGGFADKAKHDEFCAELDCVILSVLDQSPMKNHLTQRHGLVNASRHPIVVGDDVGVYGMWFDPGYGYVRWLVRAGVPKFRQRLLTCPAVLLMDNLTRSTSTILAESQKEMNQSPFMLS